MSTMMEKLRLAAEQTVNFQPAWMRDVQLALINLFQRCGAETTAGDALDGILHCGPDGVMDARIRGIAVRFLSQLPHDHLVEDLRNELLQDWDCEDINAVATPLMTLSNELTEDAKAIRGRSNLILNAEQVKKFADDLDQMAHRARRLEQRNAALEAQVRAQAEGRILWRYVMPANMRHTSSRIPFASGGRA